MSITIAQLKKLLVSKNIQFLYHVNTVATSITFLQHGGLISRGAVEDKGLHQTPQQSDDKDKALGVFYDIFFDTDDIHARTKSINHYGPITFVYSVDLLDSLHDEIVRVTKDNPIRWSNDSTEQERYFTDETPMRFEFNKGNLQQHLTICNMQEPLPFKPYLSKVLIENPKIQNTTYFDKAHTAIQVLLQKHELPELETRGCPDDCTCYEKYATSKEGYTYYRYRIR